LGPVPELFTEHGWSTQAPVKNGITLVALMEPLYPTLQVQLKAGGFGSNNEELAGQAAWVQVPHTSDVNVKMFVVVFAVDAKP